MLKYLVMTIALVSICFAEGEWVVQDNPFNGDDKMVFSDVSAVDSLHCWVVGYYETGTWVLRTNDGGKNWISTQFLTSSNISNNHVFNDPAGICVKFIDTLRGWFGWGWSVFSTTDGGEHWQETHPLDTTMLYYTDVEFTDPFHGWLVSRKYEGGLPQIVHTGDGGTNWNMQDYFSTDLRGVCFLDSLKGFVVGDSGTLLRTIDGGTHWLKINSGTTKTLMDVQFADSLHGIAVGNGITIRTIDGGLIWKPDSITDNGIPVILTDIAFPDTSHAWSVGGGAHIIFSSDEGIHWQNQTNPAYYSVFGASFVDSLHGWAAGAYGRIIYYSLPTGIAETGTRKLVHYDLQIYPNPIRKTVKLTCFGKDPEKTSLQIYNASGSLVKVLKISSAGQAEWDGKDGFGNTAPAGVYFCRLGVNGRSVDQKKIVLVR